MCILCVKYSCWAHAAIEITLLVASELAQKYPNSNHVIQTHNALLHWLRLTGHATPSISYPTLRIFGALLGLAASWIRYLCFRELGRHFTFYVAVLEDHKLVTTGPYAVVRHPSYTMAFLKYISNFLWYATPGAWLWESGFYEAKVSFLFIGPSVLAFLLFTGLMITRPGKEDEMLKKEFGKTWDQWAKRVPYRLVPGVY